MLLNLLHTHFSGGQLLWIAIFLLVGMFAVIFFLKEQFLPALALLFISGLIIRLFMAHIDPFLNLWDEQFHALVAKNMLADPFSPMLYKTPVLDYDFKDWLGNHIWLHKQPFFLWLIALSFRILGVSEFALRLPSAIMFSLMILLIYRIGTILVDRKTGWLSAFLYTFSGYYIEFVSGRIHTDHNDVAFIFLVTASIWSFLEYSSSNKLRWILLTGVFAGSAILTKWILGLLVYFGWFSSVLYSKGKRRSFASYQAIALSALIALAVAVPWQIHILRSFPQESHQEYGLSSRHFFEVLEGHKGGVLYHVHQVVIQYGAPALLVIAIGLVALCFTIRKKELVVFCLASVGAVFLFFTLAKTKMPMFTSITCSILFIAMGIVLKKVLDYTAARSRHGKVLSFALLVILGLYTLNIANSIERLHTDKDPGNDFRRVRLQNAAVDKRIGDVLPSADYVVFNCDPDNAVPVMFYNNVKAAYGTYVDEPTFNALKKDGVKMAVFVDEKLPAYFLNDSAVIKLYDKILPTPE